MDTRSPNYATGNIEGDDDEERDNRNDSSKTTMTSTRSRSRSSSSSSPTRKPAITGFTPTPNPGPTSPAAGVGDKKELSRTGIGLIAAFTSVFVVLAVLGLVWYLRRRKRGKKKQTTGEYHSPSQLELGNVGNGHPGGATGGIEPGGKSGLQVKIPNTKKGNGNGDSSGVRSNKRTSVNNPYQDSFHRKQQGLPMRPKQQHGKPIGQFTDLEVEYEDLDDVNTYDSLYALPELNNPGVGGGHPMASSSNLGPDGYSHVNRNFIMATTIPERKLPTVNDIDHDELETVGDNENGNIASYDHIVRDAGKIVVVKDVKLPAISVIEESDDDEDEIPVSSTGKTDENEINPYDSPADVLLPQVKQPEGDSAFREETLKHSPIITQEADDNYHQPISKQLSSGSGRQNYENVVGDITELTDGNIKVGNEIYKKLSLKRTLPPEMKEEPSYANTQGSPVKACKIPGGKIMWGNEVYQKITEEGTPEIVYENKDAALLNNKEGIASTAKHLQKQGSYENVESDEQGLIDISGEVVGNENSQNQTIYTNTNLPNSKVDNEGVTFLPNGMCFADNVLYEELPKTKDGAADAAMITVTAGATSHKETKAEEAYVNVASIV